MTEPSDHLPTDFAEVRIDNLAIWKNQLDLTLGGRDLTLTIEQMPGKEATHPQPTGPVSGDSFRAIYARAATEHGHHTIGLSDERGRVRLHIHVGHFVAAAGRQVWVRRPGPQDTVIISIDG